MVNPTGSAAQYGSYQIYGQRDKEGRPFGTHTGWLQYDWRRFSDILGRLGRSVGSVSAYRTDVHLDRTKVSDAKIVDLCADAIAPSVKLDAYLSAVIPREIAGAIVLRNRAAAARRPGKPEVRLDEADLQRARDARLLRLSRRTGARGAESLQLVEFLEQRVLAAAHVVDPQAEVNMYQTFTAIASNIGINYRELVGGTEHLRSHAAGMYRAIGNLVGLG